MGERALLSLAKRDRALAAAGLAFFIIAGWVLTLPMMIDHAAQSMMIDCMADGQWSPGQLAMVVTMWMVMMTAMMTPSAAPLVLAFVSMSRGREPARTPIPSSMALVAGYLGLWLSFSVLAAVAQEGMQRMGLISGPMVAAGPTLGGLLAISVGLYQITPIKQACLAKCRVPLGFLLTEWREGVVGALTMGMRHALFCLGCCWMLMLLQFVGGVMSILWMVFISVFVLAEKVLPHGAALGRGFGALCVFWGAWKLATL